MAFLLCFFHNQSLPVLLRLCLMHAASSSWGGRGGAGVGLAGDSLYPLGPHPAGDLLQHHEASRVCCLATLLPRAAMEAVAAEVNAHAAAAGQPPKTVDEVAMGFVRVANETMCRPIRALTQMKVMLDTRSCWALGVFGLRVCCAWLSAGLVRGSARAVLHRWRAAFLLSVAFLLTCIQGYDVTQHVLSCFGGAGGQHACAIAAALGMRTIFVHRYSGILSAVGIGLAEVVQEAQVTGQLDCGRKPACSLITSGPANTVTHGKPGRCSLIEQLGIHRAALNKLPTMPLNPHATHLSSHRSRLQLR